MKLVHENIDKKIDFEASPIQLLVIENAKEMYNLTSQLFRQSQNSGDGGWVLSDKDILDISKSVLFIHDVLDITFGGKKLEALVNNHILEKLKKGDYISQLSSINSAIIGLNREISNDIDFAVEYKDEFGFEDVVKLSNYKIKQEQFFLDNLVTYIDLYIKLRLVKVVCFVNIFSFLDEDDVIRLIKELKYHDVKILFIESVPKYTLQDVEITIIDRDLCVI